ncbi:MAG: cytochrome b N-terminal domain-containing protein [Pirellulales bacterium]|nr:cytochrome b N-terminal domain-containing protein [Pirellulales bacterium]
MLHWLNDRTGCCDAWRRRADAPLPGGAGWWKTLPAAVLFVFCVQAITGFFLWTYYSPGAQSAWESVYYLQSEVAGGWLLRAAHHYAGQTLPVLVGLYLIKQVFSGTYRRTYEAVFWITLLMALCTLGLLLTGDLLAWSQNSYAATQVRVKFLTLLPGVGEGLYRIAVGGPAFGNLTLTRFLALHVGLLSGGMALLLILHGVFLRRADHNLLPSPFGRGAGGEGKGTKAPEPALTLTLSQRERGLSTFWPDQAWRNALVWLGILAVILLLALMHGTEGPDRGIKLGSPADLDPAHYYAAARPEWIFRGLYQFAQYFPGLWTVIPIFVIPGVLLAVFLLMPWFGKNVVGHFFNLLLTAFLVSAVAVLSYLSYMHDAQDPAYSAALKEEDNLAERVIQLARAKGIPPTGALTLLRNDPLTQGRRVFQQHCAACHTGAGVPAVDATAPNLTGFASRPWLAGLLDPQKIRSADYFGYKDSPFKGGRMVGHVMELLSDLDDDEKEDLKKLIMALSAEARLPAQRNIDARDAKDIEAGRKLIAEGEFGCTDCHRFHGKGQRVGPELTGYGSTEWITAITGNPASKRFYGARNDRMPAYAETDDETKNLLRNHDLEMTAEWLRGEWFRPKK